MAKTIVFPTDFSTASDAALEHAAALSKSTGASLLIVHVEEPPLAYGGGELYYGLPEPDSAPMPLVSSCSSWILPWSVM